ncbi:hypothetical protein AB0M47_08875 [Hamadaea sp. NPDC051192]|uniref:hypothetical protein n=1 Tax=Hamadaea sp. NPDC051192 TaxID=3154940 RepID=UPI00341CFAEF
MRSLSTLVKPDAIVRRRIAAGLAGIAAVVALIAVAVGEGRHAHDAARPAEAQSDTLPPQTAALLYAANEELIRRCMAAQGYPYQVAAAPPATTSQLFPYVLDDVAWARAHAYFAGGTSAEPANPVLAAMPDSRRAAYAQALNGGPGGTDVQVTLPGGDVLGHSTNGCEATAEGQLYGDFPAWFTATNAAQFLISRRQRQVVADPAYTAGVHTWVDCMSAAGLQVASPAETARQYASGTDPTPDQVRAAVAEATCAQQTGLAALARQLDAAYRARMSTPDLRQLDEYRRLAQDAIPRAQAVLKYGARA